MKYLPSLLAIFSFMSMLSCDNSFTEIREFSGTEHAVPQEITTNIQLLYSDSAIVKVRINSPKLIRQTINNELKEVFPEGLHVEFLSENGSVSSYMDASYATRIERHGTIVAEDSVVVYNRHNDKLETEKLIWNEFDQTMSTSRFVRITRPEKGDTIYGYGLTTDQEFSRFELKDVIGKSKFEKLSRALK